MNTAPRPTPLRAQHQRSGARLVDFAGWELPVQFTGIQAEHRLVREQVGLFDVSHMGRLSLRGDGTEAFLDSLLPYDVQRLSPGRMAYTVMCNDSGGAIDDLAVYCLAPQDYLLVINASRATHDLSWIRDHATRTDAGDVTIVDRTPGEAMIAVQGPEAEALVAATIGPESKELGFFRCLTMTTEQGEWLVSRSGYTGEDGFEIICPAAAARDLWQQLQRGGARPAGLAARDTLRLEAGLCLYGNELSEQITPLEAGLEWTLALDKETDFPGREALRLQRQKGVRRRLLGLRLLTRGIPRAQQSVVDGARPVGEITSGTHSPVLKQGIAMAYVDEAHADCGHRLQVVGRGGGLEAEVVELPFVPSQVKRRRKKEQHKKREARLDH